MNLKSKLLLLFISILIIPFIIIGYFSLKISNSVLENEMNSKFTNIIDSKSFEFSILINDYKNAVENIANFQYLPIMLKSMNSYFNDFQNIKNLKDVYVNKNPNPPETRYKLNNVDEDNLEAYGDDEYSISDYDLLHRKYHPNLVKYALAQNIEDIYLINPDGDIIYSMNKGDEFTENLTDDNLKNTSLGVLFESLKKQTDDKTFVEFSKIELYKFKNNKPILFIGTPFIYRYSRYGYIIIAVNFENISNLILKKINTNKNVNAYVLNSQNILITKIKKLNPGQKFNAIPKENNKIEIYKNFENIEVIGISSEMNLSNEKLKIILEENKDIAFSKIKELKSTLIIVIFATLVIAIFIAIFFANSIVRPIKQIESHAIKVSNGELKNEISVKRKDEIGLIASTFKNLQNTIKNIVISFNNYSNTIKNVEEKLDDSANELNDISAETFTAFEEIKENLEVVSSSTEETTANIEEITSSADLLSKSADNLNTKTKEIAMNAVSGRENIQKMISDVSSIENLIEKSNSMILRLFEKSKAIEEIVDNITSISEQTNLLALNAAIEAARAGEAGKGFAVVADEIRKLADESNNSAANITENLNSLVSDAKMALDESSNITKNVTQIITSIKEIGAQMENILSEIDNISLMVEDTSNISNQQKISTSEITNAIEAISVSIQNITEKVENVSKMMNKQKLKINDFDILIDELEKMTKSMNEFSNKFEL